MSIEKFTGSTKATPPSDQSVLDFLRQSPDFFLRHPSALSELSLPHESGEAVSLIERQIDILRERNVTMRKRMNELLQAARMNDEIFAKTRSLNLALLEVDSWPELNEVLATHVLVDFEADFVCAHLCGAIWRSRLIIFSTTCSKCLWSICTVKPAHFASHCAGRNSPKCFRCPITTTAAARNFESGPDKRYWSIVHWQP